ncbi:MAG: BolA/IbaG family iron-sulfur metabolism protein [Deltaproteobacteria bacterium]|nr:BolA/IbaG family iron-sulfur metabolism protein [Deltaproteobacteria bacterium]
MEPFEIESVIRNAVDVDHVEVRNPQKDGVHFDALVVSSEFEGKSLIEQHRLVMSALSTHFESALHALSLKTLTPKEWKK